MAMLKNIPRILSPELLSVLARMGHGDRIMLADANFPSASICKAGTAELIRADGHGCTEMLQAVLQLLPLDTSAPTPFFVMDLTNEDKKKGIKTPIWEVYQAIVNASEGKGVHMGKIDSFHFYGQARNVFAVVATSETALYGNIILQKGVL